MEILEPQYSTRSTEPSQAFSENKTLSSIEENLGLSAYRRCNSRNLIASDEILLSDLECKYGLLDHLTGCSRDLDDFLRKDKLSPRQKNSEVLRAVDQNRIKIFKLVVSLQKTQQKHLANYICYSCFTNTMNVLGLKGDWPINRRVVEIFNKNRPMLVTDLHPDSLLDRLLAKNVISSLHVESIRSQKKTSDKNRELVDIVIRRGTRDVEQFLKCLKEHHMLVYEKLFGSIQEAGLPLEIVLEMELGLRFVKGKMKESDDKPEEKERRVSRIQSCPDDSSTKIRDFIIHEDFRLAKMKMKLARESEERKKLDEQNSSLMQAFMKHQENKKNEEDGVETAANQTDGRESIPQRKTFGMMTEKEKKQLYEVIARNLHNMGDVFVNNEIDREMERKVHDKLAKLEETRKGWFRSAVDTVIGPALVSGIMKITYDAL